MIHHPSRHHPDPGNTQTDLRWIPSLLLTLLVIAAVALWFALRA